jgi:O-succinylbenzoate synthase
MAQRVAPLPLFERETLKAIQEEREALLKKLQRGGVDAHTRMRREDKLKALTARQIEIEGMLGIGERRG